MSHYERSNLIITTEWSNGGKQELLNATYIVETSTQKYQITIKEVLSDTANQDNVGVYVFYVANVKSIGK